MHTPSLRNFTCGRCRTQFSSFSNAASVRRSHPHARQPWRCIVEKCAYLTCEPCADFLHAELARIKRAIDENEDFNIDAAVKAAEAAPPDAALRGEREPTGRVKRPGESGSLPLVPKMLPGENDLIEVGGDSDGDEEEEDAYAVLKRPYTRSAAVAAAAAQARAGASRRMLPQPSRVKREVG